MSYDRQMHVQPNMLVFNGKTDAEGKLHLHFLRKELLLGENFEICMEKFSLNTSKIFNIVAGQYTFKYTDNNGVSTSAEIAPCKVVTVRDLCVAIERLKLFEVRYSGDRLTFQLMYGTVEIPTRVARCLHVIDSEGVLSSFFSHLNANHTFTVTADKVTLSAASVLTPLLFPVNSDEDIWNAVSTHSFQALYIYTDIVVTEFVNDQQVPNLGTYPFHADLSVNAVDDPAPMWKRISKRHIRTCYLQFADSRGKTFEGVEWTVQCRLRRRNLK